MARLLAFIQFDHVTQNLFEHLIEILLHIILIMGGLLFWIQMKLCVYVFN